MSSGGTRLNVFPTRQNLQVMKIKLVGAKKGHSLLKKKADALTMRLRGELRNVGAPAAEHWLTLAGARRQGGGARRGHARAPLACSAAPPGTLLQAPLPPHDLRPPFRPPLPPHPSGCTDAPLPPQPCFGPSWTPRRPWERPSRTVTLPSPRSSTRPATSSSRSSRTLGLHRRKSRRASTTSPESRWGFPPLLDPAARELPCSFHPAHARDASDGRLPLCGSSEPAPARRRHNPPTAT
eukprot:scaffold17660_cov116-Isochrysis_galbana.AAC.1